MDERVADRTPLEAVRDLIGSSHYDQAAQLLFEWHAVSNRRDESTRAGIALAARAICVAAHHQHTTVQWHREVMVAAEQRESELQQLAQGMLDQLSAIGIGTRETGASLSTSTLPEWEAIQAARPSAYPTWARSLVEWFRRALTRRGTSGDAFTRETEAENIPTLEPPPVPPFPVEPVQAAEAHPESGAKPMTEKPSEKAERETVKTEQKARALIAYCLGSLRVYQHNELVDNWGGFKGQSVLRYMLAHKGEPVSKEVLMDIFWPSAEPNSARRNLHQAIYSIRNTLKHRDPEVQYVLYENNRYLLNPDLELWVDVAEFERRVQIGRRLDATGQRAEAMMAYGVAESLYLGDFMADEPYEEWAGPYRERYRAMYLEIANRLSDYYFERGDYAATTALCVRILEIDNCYEEAHRRLMLCDVAQGQRHLAIRQYHACVEILRTELDVAPSDETTALYKQITARSS